MKISNYTQTIPTTKEKVPYYQVTASSEEEKRIKSHLNSERFHIVETEHGIRIYGDSEGAKFSPLPSLKNGSALRQAVRLGRKNKGQNFSQIEVDSNLVLFEPNFISIAIPDRMKQEVQHRILKSRKKPSELSSVRRTPIPEHKEAHAIEIISPSKKSEDNDLMERAKSLVLLEKAVEEVNKAKDNLGSNIVLSVNEEGFLEVLVQYGRTKK